MRTALLLCCALALPVSADDDLKDFTSDGCSLFPDGTLEEKLLWHRCCVEHDLSYWIGGTKEARKTADYDLKRCVESVDRPKTAALMLAGVRVGGSPWLPTRFRWGYGWPWLRGYDEVSADEAAMVEDKMQRARALVAEKTAALEAHDGDDLENE